METDWIGGIGFVVGDCTGCLYLLARRWNLVPGVDEGAFPSPDAFADAMTLSGSWIAPFGRTAGAVQSIPTLCLTTIGCLQALPIE